MGTAPPLKTLVLQDLLQLLNSRFLPAYHTVLEGGFAEPFYAAARAQRPACIQFTRDYVRSALHELAHWCVAGEARRKVDDYGYWYAPDGRTQEQQEAFFQCEIKPQAIEWALSLVCGIAFEVSVDNLNNPVTGSEGFKASVRQQLNVFLEAGFAARTEALLQLIYTRHGYRTESLYAYLRGQLAETAL